jgi:hypothetical protein
MRKEQRPYVVFIHKPNHHPIISFPSREENCWFTLHEFHLLFHFRIMFFGWELGNSIPAGVILNATCLSLSHAEAGIRATQEVTSWLPEDSRLSHGSLLLDQEGPDFLAWEVGAVLGPCPHFNDRLEPSICADWESCVLAWGFLVIKSHYSLAVSTLALGF